MKFFIIEDATGAIIRTGQCSANVLQQQTLNAGETVYAGHAVVHDHYNTTTKIVTSQGSKTNSNYLEDVRMQRFNRFVQADNAINFAQDIGNAVKEAEWRAYRQALRNVTGQADPKNIVWPTPPNEV